MAASAENLNPQKTSPDDVDWNDVLLPLNRGGNRSRRIRPISTEPKPQREVRLWAQTDLKNKPERQSKLMEEIQACINKLENSEFSRSFFDQMRTPPVNDKLLKVLGGSEHKMQMVIYGIGSIDREQPRIQLCLAILMKKKFDWIGEIEVFDPVISRTESKVMESLGCSVLSVDEQCRREVTKPTMFFMPRCPADLYDNLLEANWAFDRLSRFLVLGNSFKEISLFHTVMELKHIKSARRFTHEFEIRVEEPPTKGGDAYVYYCTFSVTSWHFFSPADDKVLKIDETSKL